MSHIASSSRFQTTTVSRPPTQGWPLRRLLVTADIVAIAFAFTAAGMILRTREPGAWFGMFCLAVPVWLAVATIHGLYSRDQQRANHGTVDELGGIFHAVLLGYLIVLFTAYASEADYPTPGALVLLGTLTFGLDAVCRAGARAISRRQTARVRRAVILGSGVVASRIVRKLRAHPEYGIDILGLVTGERDLESAAPVLGSPDDLREIVQTYEVDRVFVAFSPHSGEYLSDLVDSLEGTNVHVDIVPRLFDSMGPGVYLHSIEGLLLIGLPRTRQSAGYRAVKRVTDIAVSSITLLILSPVLLAIAAWIKVDSRGPVLYRHQRIGKDGEPLHLLKFRTMRKEACRGEEYGGSQAEAIFESLMAEEANRAQFSESFKLRDDPRVTKAGRVLRKTSLDEFPQLFNVIAGSMSLVGPRPITAAELARYGDVAKGLTSVTPGVTGYWQINGRSDMDYAERVALDRAYLATRSFTLDMYIMAKTVRVLLAKSGAF